jgi:hypothetical protein
MRMQVIWWCRVGKRKKVEYLTLKATTLECSFGEMLNTKHLPGEAVLRISRLSRDIEVRTLKISLRGGVYNVKDMVGVRI